MLCVQQQWEKHGACVDPKSQQTATKQPQTAAQPLQLITLMTLKHGDDSRFTNHVNQQHEGLAMHTANKNHKENELSHHKGWIHGLW